MPRPRRARRGRQPATKDAEIATDAPAGPTAASTTPTKQTTSPEPGSSEKENRPTRDSLSRGSLGGSVPQRRALTDATRRRDSALRELEVEDVTTTSDSLEAWALGEEDTTDFLRGRDRLRRNEVSGLDIDEDVFSSMYSGIERAPSRGRSANTSTISAGQFMRRPRAPSIVSRDGGPIRPSSRGVNTPNISSTFNFGRFRRRAREPSILGTDRRPRRETPSDESDIELGEDFAPDAVSTPLERRRSARVAPASDEPARRTSGVRTRKRKSGEMEGEEEDQPEKPSRVEQNLEDDENDEEDRPREASSVEQDVENEENNENAPSAEDDIVGISDDSSLSSLSSPRSPQSPIPDYDRPTTPVNLNDIMAPPASSGSEDAEWPSIRKLAKKRRRMSPSTPLRAGGYDDHASDASSPPSLTHSPNYGSKKSAKSRGRQTKRQSSPSPLTSHLASLLPQRRSKHVRRESDDAESGEEVDVASLGEDDDELAHTHTRSRTRGASRGGQPRSAAKERQTPGSSRRVTRTYGERNSADDSFAPLPDDSFTQSGLEIEDPKDELKKAANKFKEVDKWELEFEEVTREPSPGDAR